MPTTIVPIHSHSHAYKGSPYFIESYEKDEYINVGDSKRCGVYQSGNRWWIYFENYDDIFCKYYVESYFTREQAKEKLEQILGKINND